MRASAGWDTVSRYIVYICIYIVHLKILAALFRFPLTSGVGYAILEAMRTTEATDYERYAALKWSVIPIRPASKLPRNSWKRYQDLRSTAEEHTNWARNYPDGNIGVVTGPVSGIFVVDIDDESQVPKSFVLPQTATVMTGTGEHLYFRYPLGRTIPTATQVVPGLDIRGDGGYALLPPSVHPNGTPYTWILPPEEGIAEFPENMLDLISKKASSWKAGINGVATGSRNDTAASYAGKLLHDLSMDLWETAGWDALVAWNERNEEPLPIAELFTTFQSICKKAQIKQASAVPKPTLWLASELSQEHNDPPNYAVNGLMLDGVTLLVGKPKSGKTTLMAQIAGAVSAGLWDEGAKDAFHETAQTRAAYGKFDTHHGDVLFIAAEDSHSRFFRRIDPFLGMDGMDNLFVIFEPRRLDKGGLEDIEEWLRTYRGARLVVIDPLLAVVKPSTGRGDILQEQYNMIRPLWEMGHEYKVPIVVVHHARKGTGGVAMDSISGTLALPAAADSLLVMEQPKPMRAKLSVCGRDIEQQEIGLEGRNGRWEISLDVPQIKERQR